MSTSTPARHSPKSRKPDPFEPLRALLPTEGALLADVLMQAVVDEEGVSSPAVDEALLQCALRIHERLSGADALASASIHQLLGALYEEEERDVEAARHYRTALYAYARHPQSAAQLSLALETYQRILSRMGKREQARREARKLRALARKQRSRRSKAAVDLRR